MEDPETHIFQTRKGHRIEQMVVRWLRRSRDNTSRSRISIGDGPTGGPNQYGCSIKLTLVIEKDLLLHNYGFDISRRPPLTVTAVTAGSPAEGKLLPCDQILRINNENVENISVDRAADMVRESGDSVKVTVLRNTSSPKSSFLTAEKRAQLRSNPVKVRFAEEVIVNGHTQGNSLLFMPNVLKVYLENGQTKAFKFEKKTTVKDIILTLKEKLSINIIEHFALALEEQYNISKLYLLHEDERIEQVVQKRESHDYRCLFRVCFVPKDPLDLLQEDPVAFEYLYLQSCSDVLQERFAVEMKCSIALRLAALHIQERIHTCGQSQKISFKYIEKDWGIDNFLSPTLIRNMRAKDIKKAISFHIKRNQCILEPRQKQPISATQVRLHYLKILGDLKTYGGKIFNATLMLQDRESYVTLLVGAKYGISQIINNKLNIMTTLADFVNISRIELNPESEKVSLVKVYLQDVKPLSLLLESNNAKDIACLISGYCKLFVDSGATIFTWLGNNQVHRVSAEEGYESRACSDSEESSEVDSSLEQSSDRHFLKYHNRKPLPEEEEENFDDDDEEEEVIHELKQDEKNNCEAGERKCCDGKTNDTDSISEASDSANTESQGYKISWSSDSIDALEEDDLETCSSSRPEFFQFYTPSVKNISMEDQGVFNCNQELKDKGDEMLESDPLLCFLQLTGDKVNSPLDAKDTGSQRDTECKEENETHGFSVGCHFLESNIMEYYSICTNVSPASSVDKNIPSSPENNCLKDLLSEGKVMGRSHFSLLNDKVETLILDPPPGFGDSSSEEEFFDAADRFTPTLTSPGTKLVTSNDIFTYTDNEESHDQTISMENGLDKCKKQMYARKPAKHLRKRRSFLQTDYTSQVTFPLSPSSSSDTMCCYEKESRMSTGSHSPTVSSLKDTEGEPALLETKPLVQHKPLLNTKCKTHSPNLMEMEPDTMETKSVTDTVASSISAVRFRSDSGGEEKEQSCKPHQHDTNNGEHTADHNIGLCSGRVSPSQISLQLDSVGERTNRCPATFRNEDSNSISLFKEGNLLENHELENKTTFKNIFDKGIHSTDTDKYIGFNCSKDLTGRKLLSVAKEPIPFSSPHNTHKTQTLFDVSHATDLLFDLKGITNLFTHTPINSCKGGTANTLSNGQDFPPSEEEEHLLRYTSESEVDDMDSLERCCTSDRNTFLSSSRNSSNTALDTLELSYDEEEKKHSARLLTSESKSDIENLTNLSPKILSRNYDDSVMENGRYSPYNVEPKTPDISRVKNAGNCNCQLSYTSCFRGLDMELDDEIVSSDATVSSSPRTIPPLSGSRMFVENNDLVATNGKNDWIEHCEALTLLKAGLSNGPHGYSKLQDCVLDLQKILEDNKNKGKVHPQDMCAMVFSEQKSCLCTVSRKLMTTSQKVLKPNQSSGEVYQVAEETFFNVIEMTEVCLQFSSCVHCSKQQLDVLTNLRDLICTYNQFAQSAKKASNNDRDLNFKLMSRHCTALTAAVFCLTQHYRTLISL
ncbi:FERM and PDZ domain-containing protein 1 isoform 2-T2 [Pelodytes ibericus]